MSVFPPVPVDTHRLIRPAGVFPFKQSAIVDQPGQAPDSVGAPAETKKEYLVALFVVFYQIFVAIQDVVIQTRPRGAAQYPFPPFPLGAHAYVVETILLDIIPALFQGELLQPNDIRRVFLLGCIPGTVRKYCDPFRHNAPPIDDRSR